jgi:hypothetical protein
VSLHVTTNETENKFAVLTLASWPWEFSSSHALTHWPSLAVGYTGWFTRRRRRINVYKSSYSLPMKLAITALSCGLFKLSPTLHTLQNLVGACLTSTILHTWQNLSGACLTSATLYNLQLLPGACLTSAMLHTLQYLAGACLPGSRRSLKFVGPPVVLATILWNVQLLACLCLYTEKTISAFSVIQLLPQMYKPSIIFMGELLCYL